MVSNQNFNGLVNAPNTETEVKTVKEKAGGMLSVFKGAADENVECWLEEFEGIATLNGWPDATKAKQISTFLKGTALKFYNLIPKAQINSYPLVKAYLISNLKNQSNQQFREAMKSRVMKDNESVSDYAISLMKLCKLVDKNMTDKEMMEHFIDGLPTKIRVSLASKKPKNWDEALTFAKDKEDKYRLTRNEELKNQQMDLSRLVLNQLLENQKLNGNTQITHTEKSKKVKKIEISSDEEEPKPKKRKYSDEPKLNEVLDSIKAIKEDVQKLNQQTVTDEIIYCRYCQKPGHIQRDCYSLKNKERGRGQPRRAEPRRQYNNNYRDNRRDNRDYRRNDNRDDDRRDDRRDNGRNERKRDHREKKDSKVNRADN